jgi:hypothetical protein
MLVLHTFFASQQSLTLDRRSRHVGDGSILTLDSFQFPSRQLKTASQFT